MLSRYIQYILWKRKLIRASVYVWGCHVLYPVCDIPDAVNYCESYSCVLLSVILFETPIKLGDEKPHSCSDGKIIANVLLYNETI